MWAAERHEERLVDGRKLNVLQEALVLGLLRLLLGGVRLLLLFDGLRCQRGNRGGRCHANRCIGERGDLLQPD